MLAVNVVSALEQCRLQVGRIPTGSVISRCVRSGFRSSSLTNKRNYVLGQYFSICSGIKVMIVGGITTSQDKVRQYALEENPPKMFKAMTSAKVLLTIFLDV
ncbi:hypothetical protein TNCV_4347641 [Trichonephila clavipes]|nr:hypothetical protein TNCV_4347641 [Trichonephila clavipes]